MPRLTQEHHYYWNLGTGNVEYRTGPASREYASRFRSVNGRLAYVYFPGDGVGPPGGIAYTAPIPEAPAPVDPSLLPPDPVPPAGLADSVATSVPDTAETVNPVEAAEQYLSSDWGTIGTGVGAAPVSWAASVPQSTWGYISTGTLRTRIGNYEFVHRDSVTREQLLEYITRLQAPVVVGELRPIEQLPPGVISVQEVYAPSPLRYTDFPQSVGSPTITPPAQSSRITYETPTGAFRPDPADTRPPRPTTRTRLTGSCFMSTRSDSLWAFSALTRLDSTYLKGPFAIHGGPSDAKLSQQPTYLQALREAMRIHTSGQKVSGIGLVRTGNVSRSLPNDIASFQADYNSMGLSRFYETRDHLLSFLRGVYNLHRNWLRVRHAECVDSYQNWLYSALLTCMDEAKKRKLPHTTQFYQYNWVYSLTKEEIQSILDTPEGEHKDPKYVKPLTLTPQYTLVLKQALTTRPAPFTCTMQDTTPVAAAIA